MIKHAFLLSTLVAAQCIAKDFGTLGETFKIAEEDMIELLERRAQEVDLDFLKDGMPLLTSQKNLPSAQEERIFYFDPTVEVLDNILDGERNIFLPKGKKVNPLDIVNLEQDLLILDGTKKEQLTFAKENHRNCMWILTNGNPFELQEEYQKEIFFDQRAEICEKLAIQATPSLVTQEGKKLKIREIFVEEGEL